MLLSVIVSLYNAERTIVDLLDSLKAQVINHKCEIIIIDDCSTDNTVHIIKKCGFTVQSLSQNRGPAVCRNIGAAMANGEVLVFTDSDCRVSNDWLDKIQLQFQDKRIHAVMGRMKILESTYLGDAISALGFPAGGSIGFDKIWKVDEKGYTDSLSTCNCAIRKGIFYKVGGFDETFPFPGGEDSLLAFALRKQQYTIRYCPDIVVYHAARTRLSDFIKWQYRRGISSYIFSKKINNKGGFIRLRLWSIKNVIQNNKTSKKLPAIIFLLVLGYMTQLIGYLRAGTIFESNK